MITKIHHIGIVVRNLEEAFRFYRDTLGLRVSKQDTIVDQGVKAALLPVGHSEIELLEPIRDDTGIAKFLATRGEGMHHLCFESDDVGRELEALKAKDTPLIDQAPRPGLAGMIAFLHPKCTHKTLIEIATPPKGEAPAHHAGGNGAGAKDLDHIALAVPDLDAAVAGYGKLFGLKPGGTLESKEMGLKAVMLPVGDAFVELLTATGPDTPLGKRIAESGEGMLTLAIEVRSLDGAVAHLRSKGVLVSDATPGPIANTRIARVAPEAAHGAALQLIER